MKLSAFAQKFLLRIALMALGGATIIGSCSRMNVGLYVCMIALGAMFITLQLLDIFVDRTQKRLQQDDDTMKAKMIKLLAVAFGGMDNDI
ncbi:MAG: hypothetical protein WCW33_01265 [Candidatus Babeliales bacterium]|jgi:hypothetical protein